MLGRLLDFIRRLTSGKDNQTPDVIRIGGILIGTQFVLNAGWDLIALGNAFDPVGYGTGAGLILAAIGTALRLKQPTEPE